MATTSRTVLITGANSGVGFATAKVLTAASANYHVIIGARNPTKGADAAKAIQSDPNTRGTLSTVEIDVNSKESILAAAKHVETEFGKLDVLINNAGICLHSEDIAYELETSFKTNVIGAALTTRAFLKMLLKSSNAYVIYITSSLGSVAESLRPGSHLDVWKGLGYRVSKQAMNMLMAEDYKEFYPQGIKVFSVCPGLVESNLRGTSTEAITAGGRAQPASEAGELLLSVVEGQRDAEVGKWVVADGIRPW